MNQARFRVDVLFGSIRIETRERMDGDRLICESRRLTFDRSGVQVAQTDWEPTGVVMYIRRPRPWWKFWERG